MELEEMKTLWEEMSQRVEKLELTNNQNIMEMTQLRYKNKFSRLYGYELSGSIVCFIFGALVLLNFDKLDTWYLALCGVLFLAFYFLVPIVTLRALHKLRSIDLSKGTYKETLEHYKKSKTRVLRYQRIGVIAGIGVMFVAVPVADKILNGNDLFLSEIKPSMWAAVIFGLAFVLIAYRWGYGWYKKITNSAEHLLKDLDE